MSVPSIQFSDYILQQVEEGKGRLAPGFDPQRIIENMYDNQDRNKDGQITEDEFKLKADEAAAHDELWGWTQGWRVVIGCVLWLNIINGKGIKILNLPVKCHSEMLFTFDVCLRGVWVCIIVFIYVFFLYGSLNVC